MKRVMVTLAIAASAFITGAGLASPASAEAVSAPLTCTDAPEYMPVGACDGVQVNEAVAYVLSDCTDGLPVTIDPVTGGLYGDQDRNGRLDGDDCAWS